MKDEDFDKLWKVMTEQEYDFNIKIITTKSDKLNGGRKNGRHDIDEILIIDLSD